MSFSLHACSHLNSTTWQFNEMMHTQNIPFLICTSQQFISIVLTTYEVFFCNNYQHDSQMTQCAWQKLSCLSAKHRNEWSFGKREEVQSSKFKTARMVDHGKSDGMRNLLKIQYDLDWYVSLTPFGKVSQGRFMLIYATKSSQRLKYLIINNWFL